MNLEKMTVADSRGKESKTLFFVSVSWAVMVGKFALAGVVVPDVVSFAPMDVMNFGLAVTAILAIWLGREHTEKKKVSNV